MEKARPELNSDRHIKHHVGCLCCPSHQHPGFTLSGRLGNKTSLPPGLPPATITQDSKDARGRGQEVEDTVGVSKATRSYLEFAGEGPSLGS